jgi:hypothetical protein
VNVKIGYPLADNGLPASRYRITATIYNSSIVSANEVVKTVTEDLEPTGGAANFTSGVSISRAIDLPESVVATQRIRIEASACSSLGCTLVPLISWNVDMNASINQSLSYDPDWPDSETMVPTLSWSTTPNPSTAASNLAFTDPLALLFRFSASYESETWRTLKRMSNFEFLASGADIMRAPAEVHELGTGIWSMEAKSEESSHESDDLMAGTVLYEVLVSVPGEYELHAYASCPDSDHNSWQIITQEGTVVRWDMATQSEAGDSKSTWNIFPGGTWTVEYPGKKVWIELRVDEPGCLIERLLFNLEGMDNKLVRGRVWPPPEGTVVMQSYLSVPHSDTRSELNLTDLSSVFPFVGILPTRVEAQRCMLGVSLPPSDSKQGYMLSGGLYSKFYDDLQSKLPNIVKTVGWIGGSTDDKVSAVGWNVLDVSASCQQKDSQECKTRHAECPLAATSCFTRHGPFAAGDTVYKEWDLSLVPHTAVEVSVRVWLTDDWDSEQLSILVDGERVFREVADLNTFNANGWVSFTPCSLQPRNNCKDNQAVTKTVKFNIPHTTDSIRVEFTSNLDEGVEDEAFLFDQFEMNIIPDLTRGAGLLSSGIPKAMSEEIEGKCSHVSGTSIAPVKVSPPTKITNVRVLNLALGAIKIGWDYPRSWGLHGADQERTFVVYFHGVVTGMGPDGSDGSEAVDETGDGLSDTNVTTLQHGIKYDITTTPETCMNCFNHTGSVVVRYPHIREVGLVNLHANTMYDITVRAATSEGGNGPLSDVLSEATLDQVGSPLKVIQEPLLVRADPESVELRWRVPDWQGSPITHIVVERSLVGMCGLEDVDWDFQYDPIPIDYRSFVNTPSPQFIVTSLDGLRSDTEYVFRAKTQNRAMPAGLANQWSDCCTRSISTVSSSAFVDVSSQKGNDTLCSQNGRREEAADPEFCQTIHGALNYNRFEDVMLQLHQGHYSAHDSDGNAIKFWRPGMGIGGIAPDRTLVKIDCGGKTCVDITNKVNGEVVDVKACHEASLLSKSQRCTYPPSSFRKLTFLNASATSESAGRHEKRLDGAVIRLAGRFHPSFVGILIEDCIFENSFAEKQGGVIFADCLEAQQQLTLGISLRNVLFRNNAAQGAGGGAISLHHCKQVKLTQVTFESNHAPSGAGGAILASATDLRLDSVVAERNTAGGADGGGAFRVSGGSFTSENGGTDSSSSFPNKCAENSASLSSGAGGACLSLEYSSVSVVGWSMTHNQASLGGAIRCMGSRIQITDSVFHANTADRNGGALSGMLCEMSVFTSVFSGNAAGTYDGLVEGSGRGGAIALEPGSSSTLVSSKFVDNTAKTSGGAYSCHSCDGGIVQFNTSFESNIAARGGGIALSETKIWFRGTADESALNTGSQWCTYDGLSIDNHNTTHTLAYQTFQDQAAADNFMSQVSIGDELILVWGESALERPTLDDGMQNRIVGLVRIEGMRRDAPSSGDMSNAANGFVHFEFIDGVIPHNQGYDREAVRAAVLRDPINTFDVTRDEIAYAEMHAPSAEPSPRQIRDYIVYNQTRHANDGVLGCSLFLYRVVTGQYFRGNKATSSGGGALYWESSDRTDVPHVDPVKGAATFGGNTARYGADFASMGKRIIPAHKTYTSFNTIPFRPALKLVDSYEQIVDQSQDEHFRPQTVTVFTRSQQKLFGKTTSVINETGWAMLASLGMASEPGRQNCTFFASSAKVFEARVQVSIRNCGAGDFLRNTASQVRTIYEEWHSSKGFDEYATSTAGMTYTNYAKLWEEELGTVSSSEIQTMFAALDDDEDGMIQAEEIVSRFDSHVPCVADGQKQICTWECSACPTGRFSTNDTERGSRRSCSVCPLGFVQPETGENECLKCEIGKFSASLGGVECKLNAIDALLPNNFVGLRFLATPKFEAATVVIKWDVPIDPTIDSQGVTTSRTDIVGIQVRLSLGNGGRFEEKLIAEKVIPIDHTNATFEMSRPAIDVGCRRANAGNPCMPPHLMKYYTRVRVYTDTGFMGESAFPLKVWSIATECSEREYLDDYSCPSCESMRAEIIALLEENPSDTQSNYRLKALPSEDTVTRASAPGERLLNPLTWECVECPDGAMCRGDVLYGGIISKFGNWRVERGTRPETFERCFYPPACLGAPNTDFAGRYYDGKCTEQCRADCDTPKNAAKDGFDLDDCRYKCGFDSYCDRALVEVTDCGATAVWGKGTYNGDSPSLWPGASTGNTLDDEPLLVINYHNYKISLDLDFVAAGESRTGIQDCKASAVEFGRDLNVWQNRHMSSGDAEGAKTLGDGFHIQTQPILPYPRGPGPCGDDGAYFGFAWGKRASATPFIIESTPQYALTAQPPDVMWDHSANGGKSTAQAQFYHDNNGTVWNDVMNSSRICRAFRWADTGPSEEPTCPDSIETLPPAGEGGGMWEDISCQICPSGPNDPWGQWDKRSCEFDSNHGCTPQWEGPFTDRRPGKNRRQLNLLKISGEWMIYDYEIVPFWNNVSRTRYTQLRGFVYSSFSEDRGSESAAASPKPKIKHHFVHEGAMQIQIMMDMSHSKVLKATVQKTKVQLCHMGHLDNTMLIDQDSGGAGDSTETLFTRCDRSKGLICERCDVEMGYMQECANPAGSRCRLCTSCAVNFKRSGEARCKRCPESSTNRALLVLGVLAMIVAGAGLIYMAIEAADALDNVSDAMKKIMINYLQVTSLAAGFPLKWPEAVEQMFAAMSAVSSAGQHVLSPDCELSSMEPAVAFYAKQIMFASIPLVVFVISKMIWGGLKLFHVAYIHHARTKNGGKAACRACKSCVVLRPAVYYVDRSVLTDVVFFYFLYPTMVKQAIALFACDEVGGEWYLSADLQEECFVGRHLSWMSLIGIPQLIVYVVGMPLLSWTILMANRWRLHKKRVRFRYGMLYSGYRRKTFWWEGVVAMRKVVFVAIAGVFGSRMGPDLQCFVALFILFWFFNFHLTAHPFDEITARHRVLHHIETWALIVGWCTMWMGLIFYLGNEYGRINRGWMVFFTITIIGINVVYSAVVMVLFCKEYHLERIEARVAQSQEEAEAKLAAHMYMQERILHNMGDAKGNVAVNSFRRKMSAKTLNPANAEAEKTHRLNPRKVGRNSLGLKDRLKIRRQVGETTKDNLEIGMQNDMDDAAAFLLKPNLKNNQAHAASKAVTGGGGGSRTAVMPIDVNPAIRMQARRLKQRLLERKMGLTPAQAAHERAVSRFERLRLEKLKQKRNLSKEFRIPQGTEFIQVKMWGTPTGIKLKFVEASKGEYLVKKVKQGASKCPAEGRSRLKKGDCLIDVNGKDIRGLSQEESVRIYKMQLKEAGGSSISEDPPMWYMIFRRGMPMADEMKQSPLQLVQQGSHKHVDTGSESIEARRERERVHDTISSGITINDEETHADASENKFESFPSATGVATALIEDVVGDSGVHLNLTRVHATKQQENQWDDTLPPGWVAHLDPSSGHYYYQGPHGTTQWEKPEQPATVLQSAAETKVHAAMAAAAAEEPLSVTETEMSEFLRPIQPEPEAAKEEDVPRDTNVEALAVEPSEPQHSTAIVGDPKVGRASPEATVAGGTVAEPSEGQEPEAAVVVSEFSQVQEPKLAAAVAKPPESESVSESEMFQFLRPPETAPEAQAEEVEKHAPEEAAQASVSRLRHEAGRSVEV